MVRQALASQLATLIAQPRAGLGIGLVISLVVALWSGSRGAAALMFATSRTRQEPEKRGLVMTVLVSILATLAGAFAMIVALTLVAVLPAYFSLLPWLAHNQAAILFLRWPVLFCLGAVAIAVFYRFAPTAAPSERAGSGPAPSSPPFSGSLACALFSLYVESIGNFEATFGSLATAIVLLLWMYNSALILVLGATINAELEFETLVGTASGRLSRLCAPEQPPRPAEQAKGEEDHQHAAKHHQQDDAEQRRHEQRNAEQHIEHARSAAPARCAHSWSVRG